MPSDGCECRGDPVNGKHFTQEALGTDWPLVLLSIWCTNSEVEAGRDPSCILPCADLGPVKHGLSSLLTAL